jgi:hypothetical protein
MSETTPDVAMLKERFPGILRARSEVEQTAAQKFEAHVDIVLPQHQIIVNREGADAQSALHAAIEAARHELAVLARRDRDLAMRYGITSDA